MNGPEGAGGPEGQAGSGSSVHRVRATQAVRIALAGRLAIDVDGRPPTGSVDTGGMGRLGRLAFAYLVTERHRPVPRQELADILWGEEPPRSWETSLRVVVSRLRTWLTGAGLDGPATLVNAFGCYQLRLPPDTRVDVEEAAAALENAVAGLRGPNAVAGLRGPNAVAGLRDPNAVAGLRGPNAAAGLRDPTAMAGLRGPNAAPGLGDPTAMAGLRDPNAMAGLRDPNAMADLRDPNAMEARAQAEAAIRVANQEFLPGASGIWVEHRQSELQELRLAALEVLSDACLALADNAAALAAAEEAVATQPLRESAHLRVMAAHGAAGNRAAALRAYERCRRILADELGIPPSSSTEAAYLALLREQAGARPDGPPTDPAQEPDHPGGPARAAHWPTLPAEISSFVGRQSEAAAVHQLVRSARMVTLLGPGGVGKTRLALATATALAGDFEDGAAFVSLSEVTHPEEVPAHALSALGLAEEPASSALDTLVRALGRRHLLLVLDNCEHLAEAAATLTDALLRSSPRLTILATSREPLGVPGEVAWRVPPLSAGDAARLFVERAHSARPDREVSEEEGPAVATITSRLDGIPLAIELAAARSDVLSPAEIAAHLDDRFRLLAGGPRTAPPRHQTLRAAIDWSYQALTPEEQRLLDRLSVFAADFTLEAAARVGGSGGGDPDHDVLDLLTGLVRRSLVVVAGRDQRSGASRYRLLETIRTYAGEMLERSGEAPTARARLLAWAVDLAEAAEGRLSGPDQARWLDALADDYPNLRAALALQPSRQEALRLAAALGRFWEIRGPLEEGRRWLRTVLTEGEEGAPLVRARAHNAAGLLAQRQGDYAAARSRFEESLAIRRRLGDRMGEAAALHGLGNLAALTGDAAGARALYEESLSEARGVGDAALAAAALANLGWVAHSTGDFPSAEGFYQEALALRRQLQDGLGIALVLGHLGDLAYQQGDYPSATALHLQSLDLRRDLGDRAGQADSLGTLGHLSLVDGDPERARAYLEESLSLRREVGDRAGLPAALCNLGDLALLAGDLDTARSHLDEAAAAAAANRDRGALGHVLLHQGRLARAEGQLAHAVKLYVEAGQMLGPVASGALHAEWLEGMGATLAASGRPDQGVRLLGAADAVRAATGSPVPPPEQAAHDQDLALARATLGDADFAAAWQAGRDLSVEEALAEARL